MSCLCHLQKEVIEEAPAEEMSSTVRSGNASELEVGLAQGLARLLLGSPQGSLLSAECWCARSSSRPPCLSLPVHICHLL